MCNKDCAAPVQGVLEGLPRQLSASVLIEGLASEVIQFVEVFTVISAVVSRGLCLEELRQHELWIHTGNQRFAHAGIELAARPNLNCRLCGQWQKLYCDTYLGKIVSEHLGAYLVPFHETQGQN